MVLRFVEIFRLCVFVRLNPLGYGKLSKTADMG